MLRAAACALIALQLMSVSATAAPRRKDLGAAVAPIRLVGRAGEPIAVHGLHRFFDTVELDSASDGLLVSNVLPMEKYLLGLAEMPSSWPLEALKAQAVAARTYALWTVARPPAGAAASYGFDICASVSCQVFTGADKVASPDGARWTEAVIATAHQAVVFDGAPILARYHSTSGGRTLANSQAFPTEPDYPYLQPVESHLEPPAPLYRWEVRFDLGRVERMLARAGRWQRGWGRLEDVRTVASAAGHHYPDVVFRSRRRTVRLDAQTVRETFGRLAPRLFPGRYPSRWPTTSGRLPETLPSNRIEIATSGRVVRIVGRGWGHGVGMSQWGAHGLARRGADYVPILQHYYTGTTVETVASAADDLEVGVDWGLDAATVTGSFDIVDGRGKRLVRRAVGTWRFVPRGPGVIAIDPPRGFGLPLEVAIARAPETVGVGDAVFLTVALSRPAEVSTKTFGSPTGYVDPGSRVERAGRARIPWLAPLEPGVYRVEVRAVAGGVAQRSEPVEIQVRPPPDLPAAAERRGERRDGGRPAVVVGAVAVALVVAVVAAAALGRMEA